MSNSTDTKDGEPFLSSWIETEKRMPPSETSVLCVFKGSHRILERRLESDGHEASYRLFGTGMIRTMTAKR